MSGFNFNFSPENFGFGLLTGWGTAYLLYKARNLISEARDSVGNQAQKAREFAVRSADSGYINDLLKVIEQDHLAGGRVALSDIIVEPRFIKAPELVAPREESIVPDVFYPVPLVQDHPYLHAPYNIRTLSLAELDNGDRTLALLGLPGSGRTTALYAIALWSLGIVDFAPPKDKIQSQLEAEERSKLKTREDSAKRYSERVLVEDIAEQALSEKKGTDLSAVQKQGAASGSPFRQLTPFYTHLANVTISAAEFGRNVDPAEPLVRALQHYTSYNTRMKMARNVYQRLADGRALLLLDGLDDLPPAEQKLKLEWLHRLRETYSNNFIIVTGSVRGYGGLQKAGYTPVFLRAWHDPQTDRLSDFWQQNWGKISTARRQRNTEIDSETIRKVKARSRTYTPFELTLRMWSLFNAPTKTDLPSWLENYLGQRLPNTDLDELQPKLIKAAELQLRHGFILPEALGKALGYIPQTEGETEANPPEVDPTEPSDELGDELDSLLTDRLPTARTDDISETYTEEGEVVDVDAVLGGLEVDTQMALDDKKNNRLGAETLKLLRDLTKNGILRRYRGGRYQFSHPLLASYFAAMTLQDMSFDRVLRRSQDPVWHDAFIFAAAHTPLDDLVRVRMESSLDVLLNTLLDTAQWIKYAHGTVEWVPPLMRTLGKLFAARRQYPAVRERIAAALVGTYDKNAIRIFERSLSHPDANVRRLSCLGLGALQHNEAVNPIARLMMDSDPATQIAAALSLAAIGTQDALEEIAIMFTRGNEALRQTIAESFAAIPDEGYPVLFDAVNHEDMMVRRAAVFGLRRINAPWALVSLYDTSLADDEWYVKSAAEQAFLDMQYGDVAAGPKRYPQAEQIPWLVQWVNSLDEITRKTISGQQILRRALEEGDPDVQFFAVSNIGQLGLYDQTGIIYTALRHRESFVRDAAYRALADIQLQIDEELPTPVAVS